MQVVAYWHKKQIAGRNLYSIETNISVGADILKQYLDKAKGNEALALRYYCGYRGPSAWKYVASVKNKKKTIVAFIDQQRDLAKHSDSSNIALNSEVTVYAGPSMRDLDKDFLAV
jgi:soluble lytic murein transglycosylase-like protein